jgi:hypothetical protein
MTPNTSPKKPEWFSLIESDAPSAQVRKVEKRLPVATAFAALAIVATGAFFANASITSDSLSTNPAVSALATGEVVQEISPAANQYSNQDSNQALSQATNTSQISNANNPVKVASPQSLMTITDPTLNGGGDDDEGDDDDDDDDDDRD